jgi:hypothetical protein
MLGKWLLKHSTIVAYKKGKTETIQLRDGDGPVAA